MHALTLLLGDGRFPGGGHAHSGGLEAAAANGTVADLDGLRDFLVGRLTTTAAVDAWAAAVACVGERAALVEAEYEARCPSPALRAAGRAQGRGLKRAAACSWPEVADCGAEQHAVVLGLVARAAGLSPSEAASLALHAVLMGAAAAAVRLLPIDMADAAAVVAGLAPLANQITNEITNEITDQLTNQLTNEITDQLTNQLTNEITDQLTNEITHHSSPSLGEWAANGHELHPGPILERFCREEWPAWSAPALELLAEEHARWEVRLFAS